MHRRKPSVYVPLSVVSDESDCDDSSDRSLAPGKTSACAAAGAPVDSHDVAANRVVDDEDTDASSGDLGGRPAQGHTRGPSTVVASEGICGGSPPAVPALSLSAPAAVAAAAAAAVLAAARAEAAAAVVAATAPLGGAVGHATAGPTAPADVVKLSRPSPPALAPVTGADLPQQGRGHRRRPSVWVPPQSSASDEEDA